MSAFFLQTHATYIYRLAIEINNATSQVSLTNWKSAAFKNVQYQPNSESNIRGKLSKSQFLSSYMRGSTKVDQWHNYPSPSRSKTIDVHTISLPSLNRNLTCSPHRTCNSLIQNNNSILWNSPHIIIYNSLSHFGNPYKLTNKCSTPHGLEESKTHTHITYCAIPDVLQLPPLAWYPREIGIFALVYVHCGLFGKQF